MSKRLLIETQLFEGNMKESKRGTTLVTGVLQRAGAENQNGRVYSKRILEREVDKYQSLITERRALGELDHPDCFSEGAEIMTKDGWKLISDISEDEVVYTLNTDSNEIELHRIHKKINEQYSGKMFHLKGRNIDTMVTPNHRLYLVDRYGKKSFHTVEEIFKNRSKFNKHYIPKTGVWVGDTSVTKNGVFSLPGVDRDYLGLRCKKELVKKYSSPLNINAETWFKFIGFYLGDGGLKSSKLSGGNSIHIVQVKEKHKKYLDQLFSEFPDDVSINKYTQETSVGNEKTSYVLTDARIYKYLETLGLHYEKYIPFELKNAASEYLELMIDAFVKADGRVIGDAYKKTQLFSTSKKLVDDFHEVVIKTGKSGNLTTIITKDDYEFAGRVINAENKKPLELLNISSTRGIYLDERHLDITEVDYSGDIHCVSVPNETFYVRHNKKSFWTGNSSVINLKNVSHNIQECHWEGNNLIGTVEILSTPSGNILKELLRADILLGISSRGMGSVKPLDENRVEVGEDYELIGWDFVSNPSTHGAFMRPVNESLERYQQIGSDQCDIYCKSHDLMREIITELN